MGPMKEILHMARWDERGKYMVPVDAAIKIEGLPVSKNVG
jgi:hypothetical protein